MREMENRFSWLCAQMNTWPYSMYLDIERSGALVVSETV